MTAYEVPAKPLAQRQRRLEINHSSRIKITQISELKRLAGYVRGKTIVVKSDSGKANAVYRNALADFKT
jgi:hypothetical protein